MFSSVKNFFVRHRRKFAVASIVFGSSYFLLSFAKKRLMEWQEQETKKFLDMTRKKQHFESTEQTCNKTILSLTHILCDNILGHLDTTEIVEKLQQNPENKLELWEQLKVTIFTRICSIVYALCMLQVILRVQLNVIGGYLYKDCVSGDKVLSSEVQSRYLCLSQSFVYNGVPELVAAIQEKVREVVKPISLKTKVSLQDMEQVFWSVQTLLCTDDKDPLKDMALYLAGGSADFGESGFEKTILDETVEILRSDEAVSLATSAVSRSFSTVTDEMAHLFVPKTNKNIQLNGENHIVTNGAMKIAQNNFVDVNKVEIHLAKLLSLVNELVAKEGRTGMTGILVQQLTLSDKLRLLGANIYEVFSS